MNCAHRELQVPGARLRYRDDGAGGVVVFVHGWTLDLDAWEPQSPLAAAMRIVRYDRRGFGLSTGRPSLAADVEDLANLLDSLQIVSPLLVGMSQGARVVLEFAARNPGVARGLVLDGPPLMTTVDATGAAGAADADLPMDSFMQLATRDGLDAFKRLWSAHPLMQLVTDDQPTHALLARILARYPGHDLAADGASPRETIDAALLAQVHTPSLIVNGAGDTEARRRAGRALRAALPAAEYTLIPQAAHLPNLDAPHAYNQLISGFARRHLSAAA